MRSHSRKIVYPWPSHNNILAAIWKRQVDLVSPGFRPLQQDPESAFQDVGTGATGFHHVSCYAIFGVEFISGNLEIFSWGHLGYLSGGSSGWWECQ